MLSFTAGAIIIGLQWGMFIASSTFITRTCPSFAVSCAGPEHHVAAMGGGFPVTPKQAATLISLSADIKLCCFLILFIYRGKH